MMGFDLPKPQYDYEKAVVKGSGNCDHLMFFNVHLYLSTQASGIFDFNENTATAVRIPFHDLWGSSQVP